jgi:bifunctional UDP-N-acetylglucosamine pyrophosphorylase/glucosamine-1-phosphate N-acetyltransferase
MTERRCAAVVLCAGKGTRMKSQHPKVLHPVLGRPLGAWSLGLANELNAAPLVVVVGHEAERVEAGLRASCDGALAFALQAEQKGTGHAVQMALPSVPEDVDDVLILYGDTPLLTRERLQALLDAHAAADTPLSMLVCELDDPSGYGRVVRDDKGAIQKVVEDRDCDEQQRAITEWNPGIYVCQRAFLADGLSKLEPNNDQGELYLTDLVEMGAKSGGVTGVDLPPEDALGVNDRAQLAEATGVLAERLKRAHMKAGVTLLDPARTWIEATVELGQDVVIHPGVSLKGATKIEAGVEIHEGCVLTDSLVEAGATLHPYSICEDASVGPKASVGPFGRMRPAARLEEGAKIGNFVEMKKATLGKGSKANHLAYIGDATIGEGCNIGAGTITCNYDGFGKHQTVMGDRVFIGSNSTLVAPVTIETDAYVGAGSTVNKNVPADALAISRAKQENKEGYAARIRRRNEARKKKQGK